MTRSATAGICSSPSAGSFSTISISTTSDGAACSCAHAPAFRSRLVCLNRHHWLANRMREEGIDFQQCSNAFMRCAKPERLADALTPRDLVTCGQKWLSCFTPRERDEAGYPRRLFFAQTEFSRKSHVPSPRRSRQARQAAPRRQSHHRPAGTRSQRSPAAKSAIAIGASCRPRSSAWTSPTRSSAATIATASSSSVRDPLILRAEASTQQRHRPRHREGNR